MRVLIVVLALLVSHQALACKVARSMYDLKAFLATADANAVVFSGVVMAVETSPDGMRQTMVVQAAQWWRGMPRDTVVVLGALSSMKGTDCEGVFDFSSRVGATIVVAGHEHDGRVFADPPSRNVLDGKLPEGLTPLPR